MVLFHSLFIFFKLDRKQLRKNEAKFISILSNRTKSPSGPPLKASVTFFFVTFFCRCCSSYES